MELTNQLSTLFDQWNKDHLSFKNQGDFIEITTPFVDMHHDLIQLYLVEKKEKTPYVLTDDGYILNELQMLGVDVNNTQKRKDFFEITLKVFGVEYNKNSNELYVTFNTLEDYPKRQHNLLQCIIKISDMLLTSKNTVVSIFTEEITNYFETKNVIFSPNLGFIGKTGNQQTFDFVIPHSPKKNEKLIKAVNKPASDNYTNTLFPFTDVQSIRSNSEFIVIANDVNTPIADKFQSSLTNWEVKVLPWSQREDWVNDLLIF
ncbi:DUF1828 domain-containing protein [Oceanobacillus sojae]|uniref:DUF1828 domain-containing protein n=1 Tax=Oceanobacillus sojae TaxID=582851 RepID=UPI00158E9AD5|nr:DUF1829 domain-containing protein [Oceanobacillus sojae]